MCETTPAWVALAQGGMFVVSAVLILIGLILTVKRLGHVSKVIVAIEDTRQEVESWREKL